MTKPGFAHLVITQFAPNGVMIIKYNHYFLIYVRLLHLSTSGQMCLLSLSPPRITWHSCLSRIKAVDDLVQRLRAPTFCLLPPSPPLLSFTFQLQSWELILQFEFWCRTSPMKLAWGNCPCSALTAPIWSQHQSPPSLLSRAPQVGFLWKSTNAYLNRTMYVFDKAQTISPLDGDFTKKTTIFWVTYTLSAKTVLSHPGS